jgi:hypothetical protein
MIQPRVIHYGKSVMRAARPWGTFFISPIVPSSQNGSEKLASITIMAPLAALAPDAGRVTQCLVQKRQQLSPACGNVFNRPVGVTVNSERPLKVRRTKY